MIQARQLLNEIAGSADYLLGAGGFGHGGGQGAQLLIPEQAAKSSAKNDCRAGICCMLCPEVRCVTGI
jgi:hypothetical protein